MFKMHKEYVQQNLKVRQSYIPKTFLISGLKNKNKKNIGLNTALNEYRAL